jgi:hypothetical protein
MRTTNILDLAAALGTMLHKRGHEFTWAAVRVACERQDRDDLLGALGYAHGAAETMVLVTERGETAYEIARRLGEIADLARVRLRAGEDLTEAEVATCLRELSGHAERVV